MKIESDELPEGTAIGEVAMFTGLSKEDDYEFGWTLDDACKQLSKCQSLAEAFRNLPEISSIRFGFESALLRAMPDRANPPVNTWLNGDWGIRINGLIWMGDKATMRRRIREKLDAGFHCIKLKIGGLDFGQEIDLLREIRREFSKKDIELRLDANGAFTPENALDRLNRLAYFDIHSIEQPIKAGQLTEMAEICRLSPIPIALDEELIGFSSDEEKRRILDIVKPQYIILKPSLCGGFEQADKWIAEAEQRRIGWWGTSALESNVGLEALGIWTAGRNPALPQGLGTGALYTNNIPSPLRTIGERLWYKPETNESLTPSLNALFY